MKTKRIAAAILVLALGALGPGAALAGSSTDAALGLGAFAVFNQMLAGTGLFGLAYPAPAVVVAPPRPVVVAPPPVVVAPAPVVVVPAPVTYYPAPVYYAPAGRAVVRGWCPPGHAKHGRC